MTAVVLSDHAPVLIFALTGALLGGQADSGGRPKKAVSA